MRSVIAFVPAIPLVLFACSSASDAPSTNTTTTTASITFHEHVESIVQEKCQSCHHEGGIAPFSLVKYADAKRLAPLLVDRVKARTMPPWGAFETAECKPRFKWSHDLRLTDAEIETIAKWSEQGAVEGDPSKAPPPKTFGANGLPTPSDELATAKYTVKPSTSDELRCFVVDPKLTEDTYIEGTNVIAGDASVVHHVIVYADPKRASLAKAGDTGSYPCFGGPGITPTSMVLAWAPGVPPAEYPNGVALGLQKDSLLVVQIHYHPGADPRDDSTKIQLRRAKAKPAWNATISLIGNFRAAPQLLPGPNDPASGPTFLIPAGVKNHTESMEVTIPTSLGGKPLSEMKLASVGSHMHWLGKDLKVDIERGSERPGQPKSECLLQTPKYDFNWQRGYAYDTSIETLPTVAPGDKLKIKCTYDNSTDNPYVVQALEEKKMSAPVDVTLGEETLDEMCLGAFVLYSKAP